MSALQLRRELNSTRHQTDSLFRHILPEALYERPVEERHRLIFYLGHFDAFDWNLLARKTLGWPAFHATFDSLFERGIDPEPGKAPTDSPRDWPSIAEIERYTLRSREIIDTYLHAMDPTVVQMAIEHRQMHAETFAYMMHGLSYEKKVGAGAEIGPCTLAPANPMIYVPAGSVTLGQQPGEFGWDNEHTAHQVDVGGFSISKFKISNGEYLAFVREGGSVPHFWDREGDQWQFRGMFEKIPLQLNHPVWVTRNQAAAYAGWRGLRLPTEAQFQRAAELTTPDPARDNFGFHYWDPIAVDAGYERAGGDAPVQMVGNGWEWTNDIFAPFEGFAPHPHYAGYSADFFDGQHYVMKGASPRTALNLTRPSFRNWFRPDYPHMYAGFRLVGE